MVICSPQFFSNQVGALFKKLITIIYYWPSMHVYSGSIHRDLRDDTCKICSNTISYHIYASSNQVDNFVIVQDNTHIHCIEDSHIHNRCLLQKRAHSHNLCTCQMLLEHMVFSQSSAIASFIKMKNEEHLINREYASTLAKTLASTINLHSRKEHTLTLHILV